MCDYLFVNQLLKNSVPIKEEKIVNFVIAVNRLSLLKIRDVLTRIGKIQKEDLEEKVYVATIPGGFFKKNYAVVSMQLVDNKLLIAAYADEGIVNQHTSEDAINEFERNIEQFIRK